jgi:hypothetical protein
MTMELNDLRSIPASLRRRIADLGLAKGTVMDAVMVAAVRAILFIVIPYLIISLLLIGSKTDQVISGLEEVRNNAVLAGAVLVVISFAWAYHLRITKARLLFGLIGAGLMAVYGYALFLTGGFSQAMEGLNWALPDVGMFGVVCFIALGSAFKFIRDYEFFRAALLKAKKDEPQLKPKLGMGEFDLRLGSASSAASTANKIIGRLIVRLALAFLFFIWVMSLLGLNSTPDGAGYLDILVNMLGVGLLLGIPMVVLAWFKGFYPKGTISRTVFDLGLSLTFVLLVLMTFALSGLPQAARGAEIDFPIRPIMIALALWAAIDILRALGEYGDERRLWKIRVGYQVKPRNRFWRVEPDSPFYEISPSIGRTSQGLVLAQKTFFRFVTIVEVAVILALGAARAAGVQSGPLFDAMVNVIFMILLYGVILTLISFGRGFYPAGSLGRMLVGLLMVPGLFLYLFRTFLTSEVQLAFQKAGLVIPFNLVVTLVVVSILFVGMLQVAEFFDARRAWLTSVGKKVKPLKPITTMTWLQEFRFRFGSTDEGTRWARKGMVRYLYYTTIAFIVILTIIDSTSFTIAGIDLSSLNTNLRQTYIAVVLLAIPLAFARALYGFYPAGSVSKLTFGFIMCLIGASYTYFGLQGGQLVRGDDIGAVKVGLAIDFSFIVIAFLIGWAILAVVMLVECLTYRKQWIANDYRPVVSAEVQALLKQQKQLEREERRARRVEIEGLTYAEVVADEAPDLEDEIGQEINKEIGETAMQSSMASIEEPK